MCTHGPPMQTQAPMGSTGSPYHLSADRHGLPIIMIRTVSLIVIRTVSLIHTASSLGPGNYTTLPTLLREQGYRTAGGGKVFHPDTCDGAALGEDQYAWSELPYYHAPCFQWGSLPCRDQKSTGAGKWASLEVATSCTCLHPPTHDAASPV